MDELTIGDKIYISSKGAAKLTGYAKDYVGQLCREGRVEARLVGRNWYVLEASIREHRFGKEEPAPADDKVAETPEYSAVSTWRRPEYSTEIPDIIPVLSLKPEPIVPAGTTVVADMQSAWHEWFADRKEKVVESVIPEELHEQEMPAVLSVEEEEGSEEEREGDSDTEQEENDEPEEELVSKEPEEVVALTRIRDLDVEEASASPVQAEERQEQYPPEEDTVEEYQPQARAAKRPRAAMGSSLAIKSVLVAVALVALVTAIVGTGNAKPLLVGGAAEVLKPFVMYLEGTSIYEKSI